MKIHGHYHGKLKSPTYITWQSMIQRCSDPRINGYQNYGGRGISVCDRWLKFANFLSDMGERPSGMEIDRINVDGNYTKENCRWVTRNQNAQNKRNSLIVTVRGHKYCAAEAARRLGITKEGIYSRVARKDYNGEDLATVKWRTPQPKFSAEFLKMVRESDLKPNVAARVYDVSPSYVRLLRKGYMPKKSKDQ